MSTHLRHLPDDLVLGGLGLREGLGLQHLRDDGRLLLRVWDIAPAPLLRHGVELVGDDEALLVADQRLRQVTHRAV